MCGIVGFTGNRQAAPILLDGLSKLEYRGYDSAGIAIIDNNQIDIIKENPYQNPLPYEKLTGDLKDYYSRRINIQHRLVYQVIEKEKTVWILSMWTHYESI